MFNDLYKRITSRKFLITVSFAVALLSLEQYDQMVILILGYLGVEGGADIVSKYKTGTLTASDAKPYMSHNGDDYDVDTSTVVTGDKKPDTPMFDEEPKKQ